MIKPLHIEAKWQNYSNYTAVIYLKVAFFFAALSHKMRKKEENAGCTQVKSVVSYDARVQLMKWTTKIILQLKILEQTIPQKKTYYFMGSIYNWSLYVRPQMFLSAVSSMEWEH